MAERFFLDSNIVMYAIGGAHPLKLCCAKIFERIQSGHLSIVTNIEVLQEILYRYRSMGKPDLAAETALLLMEIAEEIFAVTSTDIRLAIQLLRHRPRVNVRDAIHCATMVNNRIRTILTADRHYDQFDQLRRIDPKTFLQ